jgi:hypothetical protein
MYDTVTITTESEEHGEPCERCADAPCATNIYVVDEDGEGDTVHTCTAEHCITRAIDARHNGHAEVLVEISTAPMPWETTPAASVPAVAA